MRAVLGLLVTLLALAAPGRAEIFKCVGPNGDVRFTSSAAQCPNATPHAPKPSSVQRIAKPPAPLASARPGASSNLRRSALPASETSPAAEASWRQKKAAADRTARTLEVERERILDAVRWCNKGHGVTTENPRTGLREEVPCSEIDAERDRLEADLKRARAYQARGLEEECRAAGCLPGWVR